MDKKEWQCIEKHFTTETDQGKAMWYIRSAKAAKAAGHRPTKDRIWDQYAYSATVHGMRELLEKHKMERFIPMLKELGLIEDRL